MKELSNLKPAKGSQRTSKRRGRGYGSNDGRTAGRGHKGAQSRSGYKRRAWFEGGQMPIHRRLPKRGFHNLFREQVQEVNIRDLAKLPGAGEVEVTPETLVEANVIKRVDRPVKLLSMGDADRKYNVHVTAASRPAIEKIERAGGGVTLPPPAGKRGKLKKRSERD
ncbi:MAG: 50S ribosomal protein L15 [Calditrichaeota bacterium]|nr:50S ribosomal protein L15 [Calditrichota bacterium]